MNTDQLKKSAAEAKESARDFIKSPQVQGAVEKGKDALEKGKECLKKEKECLEKGKGKDLVDKGKDMLNKAKEKLEDFVEDKTNGKGILGFGSIE